MAAGPDVRIPDSAPPATVGVVGLGLIGASLLGALRTHLPAVRRLAVARREEIAGRAVADGLAHEAGGRVDILSGADVVVLCTPVDAMPGWIASIGEAVPGALVTDGGSTKAWIEARARELLGPGRFVGGHPLAGREQSGYDAADPGLFEGALWVLTPGDDASAERAGPWAAAVRALGAEVVTLDAAAHDAALAVASHIPFALSAALMRAAARDPAWRDGALAATGFRDMVRVAGGDPAMYAAITATNAGPMLAVLDALQSEIDGLRAVLSGTPEDARAWFAAARDARAAWLSARARSGRPVR
ncbi:MAG TPA: prephenate dehydrogenase/arogenate dehydrogenase family protein [Candidatus Dormibacteraeota bacterium]|nr:prephenate dehydrogenase/arogenate dehydrogenase family protein [Candidatus Dormibacteraeota bacterium]